LLAGAFVVAWAPLTAPRLVTISEDRYASGLLFVTLFELGVSDLISWPFFLDFSLTRWSNFFPLRVSLSVAVYGSFMLWLSLSLFVMWETFRALLDELPTMVLVVPFLPDFKPVCKY